MKQNIFCAVFASQCHCNRDICAVVRHSRQTSFHTAPLCSPHMYSMYFVHTCSLMYLKVSLPEGVLRVMKVERCEYMTQDTHMHVLFMYVTSASDYHFLSIRTALCYTVRWFCTHLVNVSGVCLCKTCRYNVWAFMVFAWALLRWCYYDCFFFCPLCGC